MDAKVSTAKGLSSDMQNFATKLQKSFGAVGDSGASGLAQEAKVYAGTLVHKAEEADEAAGKLGSLVKAASGLKGFSDPATITKAERTMEDIDEAMAAGEGVADELDELNDLAKHPQANAGAAKQYYNVMYFVDKKYVDMPQTCAGDTVAKPMIGDADACATACDAHIHECVGFQCYGGGCILLKNCKTGFYYTGCKGGNKKSPSKVPPKGKLGFLQTQASMEATCYAKLSKYESTTLAVDPSGKCEQCFNELTKADRCF